MELCGFARRLNLDLDILVCLRFLIMWTQQPIGWHFHQACQGSIQNYESMHKRYHREEDYIIIWELFFLDKNISYKKELIIILNQEPIAILNQDSQKLRTKGIHFIKVQQKHRPIKEATLEMRGTYGISILTYLRI